MNYILTSLICATIQISFWWLWRYSIVKSWVYNKTGSVDKAELVDDLIKDIIEVIPIFLVAQYNSYLALFFLLGSVVCDKFIYTSEVLGSVMFLILYSLTSIGCIGLISPTFDLNVFRNFGINVAYNIPSLCISLTTIVCLMIPIMILWKANVAKKIAACVYGLTALSLCMYAFTQTGNFGFVCLVIGDTLLIVKEIVCDKITENVDKTKANYLITSISNTFYFSGLCFIPLSLVW